MFRNTHSLLLVVLSLILPLGGLLVAGCSKGDSSAENPAPVGGSPMAGPGGGPGSGGPGGGPGGRGGRFQPVSATATAPEIFAQKCQGCHGAKGQGARGPSLVKVAKDSDDEIYQIIHNGKRPMPAFASQMTEAQMKELVAYVKKFGA